MERWGRLRSGGMCLTVLFLVVGGATAILPDQAAAQATSTGGWLEAVVGEWEGEGDYEGNTLRLTRTWRTVLGGAFLRAEMGVTMPGGGSFGATMYWRLAEDGPHEVIWLDGTGRMQELSVTRDASSGTLTTTYLDERVDGDAEWRTWEFALEGADEYVERVYRERGGERELLTVFRFRRRQAP